MNDQNDRYGLARRAWNGMRTPSPLHDGMRLIDLLPILPIGVLLLVFWPNSDGWAVLVWLALFFVSMCLTKRFVPSHSE